MFYIILTSLFFSWALAQDCPGMKDGETLRLDEKGKSLENLRVVDQDGLGVCYATSASTILQAMTPNHPELSYLHLATLSKKANLQATRNMGTASSVYANNDEPAISGGTICDTINEIKKLEREEKSPMICPRGNIGIEQILSSSDPDNHQEEVFLNAAKYMDLFQATFKPDSKPIPMWQFSIKDEKLVSDDHSVFSKAFLEIIERKRGELTEVCKKPNNNIFSPVYQSLLKEYLIYRFCINDPEKFKDADVCRVLKALAKNPRTDGSYRMLSDGINPELANNIIKAISKSDSTLTTTEIKKILASEVATLAGDQQVKVKILEDLEKVPSRHIELAQKQLNEIRQQGYSEDCVSRGLIVYMTQSGFKKDWEKLPKVCNNKELMNQASSFAEAISAASLNNINNVLDFVANSAKLNSNEAFLQLHGFNCLPSHRISIPSQLSCVEKQTADVKPEDMNGLFIKSLQENTPTGIYLCQNIFDDTKNSRLINKKECNRHAVVLTGMKCEKGQYRYLIQNSYGKEYSPKNPQVEIDRKMNGGLWFSNAAFANSVYKFSILDLK